MMTAVNFSEMKISSNPAETLVAFSIGSGIGLTGFNPVSGVGGIINFMLPDSTQATGVNPEQVPLMFADTGVPFFVKALFKQGVQLDRMKVVIAGGGLTVIANAPNPAGQSILKKYFKDGVSPAGILMAAVLPTLIVWMCFLIFS